MARNKSEVSTFLTIIQEEGGDEGYRTVPPSMITQVLFIWHHWDEVIAVKDRVIRSTSEALERGLALAY